MSLAYPWTLWFVAIVLVFACTCVSCTPRRPLPPGPRGIPILGHALWRRLPLEKPWETFDLWRKRYGDVVYLRVLNRSMLILSSLEAAIELEEKRAPLYSDRPRRVMAELSGYGAVTTFRVSYDGAVRTAKRHMHAGFNKLASCNYEATQEHASRRLCQMLRESPADFADHLREVTISVMRSIIYGSEEAHSTNRVAQDELYKDVLAQFTKMASPSQYLVDAFPFFSPYFAVKERVTTGVSSPCFLENIISTQDLTREEEEAIQYAAGSAFGAGYETTVASLSVFFMAMVLNPSTQLRAQEEIDRVLDKDSLPSFSDRASLPFVECIISEVLRWRPPVPFAWRCVRAEDHYRGYTIPAGTLVTVNVRGLTHDNERYPDPDEFKPERFLDCNGQYTTTTVPDPRRFLFGFGRRSCPGMHVADNFLYIVIATVLAAFTVSPAEDAAGNSILPDPDYSSGLGGICQPPPFPCRITPRVRKGSEEGSEVRF
ncbi:hypothetical protein VTO73DRAFT_7490 [Trametes versicolor]